MEAGITVRLLDDGCPADFDLAAAQAFLDRMASVGPRLGSAAYGAAFCATWGLSRPGPKTALDAAASPPMLILQGEHDPQTPIAGLPTFLDELGNGSWVVTWRGNGHMVAFRNACMAGAMSDFLLDPGSPPREDTCSP
jgi:pimeloyl-ACP methyl ester carboxylesterase